MTAALEEPGMVEEYPDIAVDVRGVEVNLGDVPGNADRLVGNETASLTVEGGRAAVPTMWEFFVVGSMSTAIASSAELSAGIGGIGGGEGGGGNGAGGGRGRGDGGRGGRGKGWKRGRGGKRRVREKRWGRGVRRGKCSWCGGWTERRKWRQQSGEGHRDRIIITELKSFVKSNK